MKKYILIAVLVSCYAFPVLCQYPSFTRGDSLKIENLKKILPGRKGRERVDALNQLSETYGLFIGIGQFTPTKAISSNIYFYAKEANKEALRIDYKYGVAKSLSQLSAAVGYGEPFADREKEETTAKSYLQQALTMRKDFLSDKLTGQEDGTNHEYEVAKSLLVLSEAIDSYLQPVWIEKDALVKECLEHVIGSGERLHNDSIIGTAYYYLGWFVEDQEMNYKKAIFHFHKAGDLQKETEVTWQLCAHYSFKGRYEDAFTYGEKFAQLAKENALKDSSHLADRFLQNSDYYMYELYTAAGDYETAMDYLMKANAYAVKKKLPWRMELSISELLSKMGKPDSALTYYNLWKKDRDSWDKGAQLFGDLVLAGIYIQKSQPDSAVPILEKEIAHGRMLGKSHSGALIMPLMLRAEVYKQEKDYNSALQDAKESVKYAEQDNSRQRMMDGYQQLSFLYYQLGQHKAAYETLVKYHAIKDSIQSRQFLMRLNNYKRASEDQKTESALLLLKKDNQLKEAQLKQESIIKYFLISGLLVLLLTGIFTYRSITLKRKTEMLQREKLENEFKVQQLENEKKQAEFQQQAAELEMQALRAQMNPHFIFNCLSSINRIILKNESHAASDYLTRFSRLIRMVLINSQKATIPLEDELQMLRLYLDMERLRFKNSFDYSIIFTNTIDEGAVFIPPLLLQPFCENAIWHGLMQKEGQGHLNIELSMQENILHCIISDDGIGREKAAALKSKSAEKEKSMGLAITAHRLALLNQNKNVQTFYTIEDIRDAGNCIAGTKVILKIAYKELEEQMA
jgi:tetratricopeptide (TPR) repeat protein